MSDKEPIKVGQLWLHKGTSTVWCLDGFLTGSLDQVQLYPIPHGSDVDMRFVTHAQLHREFQRLSYWREGSR